MRYLGFSLLSGALLLGLGLGFASGGAQERRAREIVSVCGVGCVVDREGSLWQYIPSEGWLTIDEAFKQDGRQTQILPLPVAAEDIQFMESWGFIVTKEGQVWHYNLQENRWEDIGTP